MSFLNAALLFGLIAVVVPPLIHLLNRRRFDTVDWAAMQFLQASRRVRRKFFIEELLLLLLRMGVLALLAFALAAPVLPVDWFSSLGVEVRPGRDTVLVVDGSASMALTEEDAVANAAGLILDDTISGDGTAVVLAGPVPENLVGELRTDLERARQAIDSLPEPSGGVDSPAALGAAMDILEKSTSLDRRVIVLTDGQRHGWADDRTLRRLDLLAVKLRSEGRELPKLWFVNVKGEPGDESNWSLGPLTSTRPVAVVDREVRFRTTIGLTNGTDAKPPKAVRLEIDGRPAGSVPVPGVAPGGQVSLTFTRRFSSAGSHLVTASLPEDAIAGDNVQNFAIEVLPRIPVLIVGERAEFLRDALDPSRDPQPAFEARVVSPTEFGPSSLANEPLVLILAGVASLSPEQSAAVGRYAKAGGGVLVLPGETFDPRSYGKDWLPAVPSELIGDGSDFEKAARPVPESFAHPALESLRADQAGSLSSAYFPRHWQLDFDEVGDSAAIAMLNDRTPLLVERGVGKGRVIIAAVPMDNSKLGGELISNLTRLPDFPRLAHELGYYLAGGRGTERNLQPGRPIVFRTEGEPSPVTVEPPEGEPYTVDVGEWPAVIGQTQRPGAYKVRVGNGDWNYFVVRPDEAESVLTPMGEADREKLQEAWPTAEFVEDASAVIESEPEGESEIWWLAMLLVVGLLCAEIALTRRMSRGGVG